MEKNEENAQKILDKLDKTDSEIQAMQEQYTFLSRKMRIYIFILFLILSVAVDLEYGIFNSSVDYLQKDLNMNNSEYGLFVSISFTGRIIGLVIFMFLLNLKHRKYTLIISIFLNGSSYILYQISTNSYLLIFAKMFAAGNKVCGTIYRPVWIEQFGLSKYKSIFFSLIQVASSYGQIIGFNLGSLLFKEKWKLALLCILGIMYLLALGFLIVPGKFFFRSYAFFEENNLENNSDNSSENDEEIKENKKEPLISKRVESVFINEKINFSKKRTNTVSKNKNSVKERIKSVFKDVWKLIKNIIFLLSIIKRSIITFILQIVHSYLKQYQEHYFFSGTEPDEDLIVLFYNISSLASTAIGGILSGIITKKLGGYENKKSIYVVLIPDIITSISVFFLAFTENFYIYNINLIIFFCFISMGNPVLQGYLIKAIPKQIKGIGVGFDMLVSTFLGKIPAPMIYGFLVDKYEKDNYSLPWKICLCYFFFGALLAFILCIFKLKEKEEKENEEDKVKLQDNIVNATALGTSSDTNDLFNIRISRMSKKRNTMGYKFKLTDERKKTEIVIHTLIEEENEEDCKSEKRKTSADNKDVNFIAFQ